MQSLNNLKQKIISLSLRIWHVAVLSKRSVRDIGASVVHVRHDRLVHRAIPLYITRSAESIAIYILVVLMENGLLGIPPF